MTFLSTTIGKALATLGIALVPVLELRASIPFGVSQGLGMWPVILLSVLGNVIPVPFIILFIRKIFVWMRAHMPRLNGFITHLEQKAERNKEKVLRYQFWGLFLLVAIPLPGTGAWTGSLVAALMDLRLKRAFPAILLGVLAAAVIVSVITYGVTVVF